MKFSLKLLLWTMIVMALGFGISGYYFVNHVFETSMDREVRQALDETSSLRFAFETAALRVPAKYDVLPDTTVGQIAFDLETDGQNKTRPLRLLDDQNKTIYSSTGFQTDDSLRIQAGRETKAYRILKLNQGYYIQTGTMVNALDRRLYLETLKDVSEVFKDRTLDFSVYRKITIVMLLCGTLVMLFISVWLTRPIRLLTRAARQMASGDYDYRVKKVSSGELGQLAEDFNKISGALEESSKKLEEEIQAREDFVEAFAHELKKPLTSMIGYADMLRSRKLTEEQRFSSASCIYTEGKRLEAMSFRLLDIIVTRRGEMEFQMVSAESLFTYLYDIYAVNHTMKFYFKYDVGTVRTEANLIKSVLMNLLDNACKASKPGGLIEIYGHLLENGYCFEVIDHGAGIPIEEQQKITRTFYMTDKSHFKSKNGAGLGLALCSEILSLHGSSLEIQSEPEKGTRMSFVLPNSEVD